MDRTLLILMWKHLVVRKRRFIHTPIEILSPVVLFVLLFSVKSYINPPRSSRHEFQQNSIHQTEPTELSSVYGPTKVFYTPDTNYTKSLMDEVAKQLNFRPQNPYSGHSPMAMISFANQSEVLEIAKELNGGAIVIFSDMQSGWPNSLKYTIRMKSNFRTDIYNAEDDGFTPHERFGSGYEEFMKLQWAIDSSYMELKSGNKIQQKVSFQEFPYVRTETDTLIKVLCDHLLPYLCWFSLTLVFVFLMSRLLEERITGIQELIRMVGVSPNTLGVSHFLNAAPAGLVYAAVGTALMTVTDNPYVRHSSPGLIFAMLVLHFVTVVAMAFACSYVVKNTQYVVSLATFLYIVLAVPMMSLQNRHIARWAIPLCGLLPHAPMFWFWREIGTMETLGVGVTVANMPYEHSPDCGSALVCLVCMAVQCAIFFAIAWYLARINPGPYGQALPWNFVCQEQYWNPKKVKPEEAEELNEMDARDPQMFEAAPPDAELGLRVENVTKVFGKQRALNDVSLDVYKGEITVLLGHNGAGKTTLMSIITGMYGATAGRVYVEGLDAGTRRRELRRLLGLCPQHNLFFPDLTVAEHVMFFSLLKGEPWAAAKENSGTLLEKLNLSDKAADFSGQLSGGTKRRLQLACALAGGARVLVLDEPTSGLDVETRRELWDLLLALRGRYTVLISTHFMEEAEALGDRVAALHAGSLRCHATPMHLKRALGTGYRVTFTTLGAPDEPAITAAVASAVPGATVKEISLNSVSYNLPARSSGKFPKLFNQLESRRSELGIESIGVGKSTLEEVFLRLCSDVKTTFTEDAVDGETDEPVYKQISGLGLYLHQLLVLMKRQFKYLWFKKIHFLLMQVVVPIIMLCVFVVTSNELAEPPPARDKNVSMSLELYELADRRVLYGEGAGPGLRHAARRHSKVDFQRTSDVVSAILDISMKDKANYINYLVGIELNDTDAKALYTTVVRHAAPVALNLLSNVIAGLTLPGDESITTYNYPLESRADTQRPEYVSPKDYVSCMMWAFGVILVIPSTMLNGVSLPCTERAAGTRHVHVMTGCPPALHWAATLTTHVLLYVPLLAAPAVLSAALLERQGTIDQPDFLGVLLLVLVVGCFTFLSFMYFVSFGFGERGASMVLIACIIIFGFITPVSSITMTFFPKDAKGFWDYLLDVCGYVVPSHTLSMAVLKCVYVAHENALCTLNRKMCPAIPGLDEKSSLKCCVNNENPNCYLCNEKYSPAKEILIMLAQFVVYKGLVLLTQMGVFNRACDRVFNARYRPASAARRDEVVRAEKAYVDKAITLPKQQIPDAMLVSDVHKNYWRLLGKSCNAVRGIDFSVKKNECFGLLGVNGAGKSTTFKMLTGIECTTRGTLYADGHFDNKTEYLRSLGYCPQFSGLDEFLTGEENLALLLTLRGLSPSDVEKEVRTWIEIVGLEQHAARPVAGYSGGCARRLAAAAALCCGRAVTLLDEPTAGVDVAARRRVWAAVRRATRTRAVVITSHSMDEMEALCDRIAILCAGRVQALGAAATLRAQHAAGHAVQLKLAAAAHRADETDGSKSELARLKAALHQKFDCTLTDEYKTMLHYHINQTMRYSELFTALERLKAKFPELLEDYSVTETTLEEVFLSFAKKKGEELEAPAHV